MTAGQLLTLLQALGPEYDKARFIYSPAPGVVLFCDNWNTADVSPTGSFWIFLGHTLPTDTYLPVEGLRTYLGLQDVGVLDLVLLIPGPTGLTPITGITLLPMRSDGNGPYVAFSTVFTTPYPPYPPPIPFDQRRSRPQPSWPNIPVADP